MAHPSRPRAESGRKRYTIPALVTLAVIFSMALAACGSSNSNGSGSKVLTAICSVGGSYTQNMSPFSPNVNCGVDGLVYENLAYVNGVTGQETPMLSTGHQYSADNLTLTFNIRQGVKWSDDQAFTANDVAFTFNMLKQYPAADSCGLWQHFSSVNATDANTVVIQFDKAAPTLLPFIEQTYIVPQHIWSSVGDPSKYTNTQPVGTGPMKLPRFRCPGHQVRQESRRSGRPTK